MDTDITHAPAEIAHRCFCCAAATALDIEGAIRIGWQFQPQRGISACPNHSITAHDVNLALMAHCYGKTVENLYRVRPAPHHRGVGRTLFSAGAPSVGGAPWAPMAAWQRPKSVAPHQLTSQQGCPA